MALLLDLLRALLGVDDDPYDDQRDEDPERDVQVLDRKPNENWDGERRAASTSLLMLDDHPDWLLLRHLSSHRGHGDHGSTAQRYLGAGLAVDERDLAHRQSGGP